MHLIAQLLLTVIQKQNAPQKAFSTVACTVRIHLISMLDLVETVKAKNKYYEKEDPLVGQQDIFGNTLTSRRIRKRQKKKKIQGVTFKNQMKTRKIPLIIKVLTQVDSLFLFLSDDSDYLYFL
ncbi:MAG: hypothetical protein IPM42_06420 [Saprospiraceae bacterium]|nr:hypothetical protein [Saprospiraceae bacterium]